ncbi:MAG: murein biosynthesis integral membrane protein MurJ [Deltaproteobacteria bacterium]|nr:murein biosynthesis integral membrane protein MurJ [Deltaproteobacteria bacterium]
MSSSDPAPGGTSGAPPPQPRLARAAGVIGVATSLSRVLGLVREQVFAGLLGASPLTDAFVVAFRIPNLLRDLFAEGALSAAFVPTFTDYLTNRPRAEAFLLANRIITALCLVLGVIVLAALAWPGPLVRGLAPGFGVDQQRLTILMTRIMLPVLPLVSLAAVCMGMLNAEGKFGTPALAPAMFNVVAIVTGAILGLLGLPERQVVVGWAVGTLLGAGGQLVLQMPSLHRTGFRWRARVGLRDPGVRRVGSLMAPATVGLAATQVNIMVATMFASHEAGANTWLGYAFRLLYLPIGVFGVAVGTAATAGLARKAAGQDMEGLRDTLRQALRLVAFLTIPSTVGLILLARPIVRLLFEHGRFTAADTEATAAALLFYSLGLFAYSAVKALAPAFYALERPRVPVVASLAAVAANLALNLSLYPVLKFRGLALGVAAAAVVNAGVLFAAFQRRYGGLLRRDLAVMLAKVSAAAVLMGVVVWGSARFLERAVGTRGLGAAALVALVPVVVGVLAYGAACLALRVPEVDAARRVLARFR